MPRPRSIDRELLLDLAEATVAATGAAGLSFGSLAAVSGLSRASVQSVFGTREALIEAMLERWLAQETQRFTAAAGPAPTREQRIRAHIATTALEAEEGMRRSATLMASLAGTERQVRSAAEWYQSRVGDLSAHTPEARRLRAAFLAAEGAFFVRYLVGLPMSGTLWREIFDDLQAMSAPADDTPEALSPRPARRSGAPGGPAAGAGPATGRGARRTPRG